MANFMDYLPDFLKNMIGAAAAANQSQTSQAQPGPQPPSAAPQQPDWAMRGQPAPQQDWQYILQNAIGMQKAHNQANPVWTPFPEGTPTLGAQELLERARNNAATIELGKLNAAISASKTSGTTTKSNLFGSLMKKYQGDLDSYWGTKPQGPSTEEAEAKITEFEKEMMMGMPQYGQNGITLKDIQSISDALRMGAGLKPKYTTNSGGLTSVDQAVADAQNPQ